MPRFSRVAAVMLLTVTIATLLRWRDAGTVPLYAARTGLACQSCHFDPNGGGPRNEFGFAYARNRHALTPEPEGSPWHDLDLTNRIGEKMPIYLGLDQRFMLFADNTNEVKGADRLGFFNMENALFVTFQPHPRLTLIYDRDGFESNAVTREAFGMIGLPGGGYLKAGRFRNPFGLRMDDHTVATRNSFLDFSGGPPLMPRRFLPYDPREPDEGLEYGMERGRYFGRVAFTNGGANVLSSTSQYAEAKTVKLGASSPTVQGAISLYDAYHKTPVDGMQRETRWGLYAMGHRGPFAVLGEVAAGTDEAEPTVPGYASGPKTNRLALFAEGDYAPVNWLNVRFRFDRLVLDRSSDLTVRDANTHTRYALEAEYVPVPFAELRATVRRIDHLRDELPGLADETQGYLQFHFSY
jgi:hypothetical protein